MSYHDLSECDLYAEERLEEASRIIERLGDLTEEMTSTEKNFVEKMEQSFSCSVKQLFWLRDLNEKY